MILFGFLLNLAYIRTKSIFLSIGLHAGVVFLIKWQHSFLRKGEEVYHTFYGKAPLYDGLLEWTCLILGGLAIVFLTKDKKV